jgi:hypothetical protein
LSACARGDHTAGTATPVQELELNAGGIDRAAHQPAERIDLAHQMTLRSALTAGLHGMWRPSPVTACRVRRHPQTRRGACRFAARMSAADDDDIERL